MKNIRFSWDKNKARLNRKKHGISFEEAETVFDDNQARLIHDPDHSEKEDRFVLLGLSCSIRLLVVNHCYREDDSEIRIISSRKANKTEERKYWEFIK